ncbi:MAG: RAMP superfamily CRISPR-associated protein [Intrasporangium sp.]|uniref:RAMP superfamily CRISPR-associated protein n=1 Tax=Intrasporangium sp. TaxID=1925024 RepID=UPI0026472E63|nr:RAMP superfamily CRISPR-associated protein [Intrasporangium sp.]MDN5797471.1 RAMP superfamily CRISPR-associated protein [Intrasporangium sp.]
MATIKWDATLTATSSIAHGGETRGTITLLRRELIAHPAGHLVHVPVISGNTLRGRLRRVGEELLRDVLGYEGLLHPAAAHALRGGGSLAKASHEPLSGNRLQRLRNLVPQIGIFGAAGGGAIIDGALDVGKVVPHVAETNHITGATSTVSAFTATQIEAYTRQDDSSTHDFAQVLAVPPTAHLTFDASGSPEIHEHPSSSQQMLFNIETFPTGTTFATWIRLRRPTDLELAFFTDLLEAFTADARIGGRIGIGHGQIRVDLQTSADRAAPLVDWRAHARDHRDEILQSLGGLI